MDSNEDSSAYCQPVELALGTTSLDPGAAHQTGRTDRSTTLPGVRAKQPRSKARPGRETSGDARDAATSARSRRRGGSAGPAPSQNPISSDLDGETIPNLGRSASEEVWSVRIKHPIECLPFRPQARPMYVPGRRDRRGAGQALSSSMLQRFQPHLVADQALGAVRINFRYASFQSMAAAHSEKAGRDQYFEGPHETFGFRLHESDTGVLDLQYQPIILKWHLRTGATHEMTFDFGIETDEGEVVFGEDKASTEYFDDPHLDERLAFAELFLRTKGASFQRRVAGGLPNDLQRRIVKDIFDARRTAYSDDVAGRVRALIVSDGGTSALSQVLNTIGEHPVLSLEIARAMMHHRLLAMPLDTPPMPDTPVTIPIAAKKGALRAFLAQHVAR